MGYTGGWLGTYIKIFVVLLLFKGFCHLISGMNIDLSSYALDIGKHLASE